MAAERDMLLTPTWEGAALQIFFTELDGRPFMTLQRSLVMRNGGNIRTDGDAMVVRATHAKGGDMVRVFVRDD